MPWPNWHQAAALTVAMLVLALVASRSERRRGPSIAAAAREVALVSFLYMLWRLANVLPLVHDAGAEKRGRQVWHLEQWLHLPSELTISRFALHHRWFGEINTIFYATVHVPALLAFLVWIYRRHKPEYPRWRNALSITTGFCLFIRFIRVAPPRLLPDLGFVDVSYELHRSVYGPPGTGISDQFAAMPSIHIAWAAIVCFGILHVTRSRWRWIGPIHLALTFLAVVATANHWWLDGIVAMFLLGVALLLDEAARRVMSRRARPRPHTRSNPSQGEGGDGLDLGAVGLDPGVPQAQPR